MHYSLISHLDQLTLTLPIIPHDRCPKVFLSAIALAATAMFWL
jgi:hypothetical protein